MKSFRIEVIIFDVVTVIALISWLFIPLFYIQSINYAQLIIPLGFSIYFFGTKSLLLSPLTIAAIAFFIISAITPLIWRSSRYSLYTSTASALFGIVMIINTFIFQQRYLHFYGYSVLPTPTGFLYIEFPSNFAFGAPLYLLIGSAVLSILNSLTRARWLSFRRLSLLEKVLADMQRGQVLRGLLTFISSLGVYATTGERNIRVKDLAIVEGKPREEERRGGVSLFFPYGEQFFIGEDKILHIDSEGELHYYDLDQGLRVILSKIIEKSEFNISPQEDNLYK